MYSKEMEIRQTNNAAGEVDTIQRVNTAGHLEKIPTVEIDNYHGLSFKCILVYIAIEFLGFAQMMVIVSSGFLGRSTATDLGGLARQIWLPQTVTIINLALAPPIAQAADYWGRKVFLLGSIIPALIGSIILSRANSMDTAIAGNVLASMSTASQPLLFAVASEILPRRYRPAAQAGINAIFALGGIAALLVGAACVRDYHEGWRIVWYLNSGLFVSAGLITFFFYNPPPRSLQVTLTMREKLNQLDFVGICVLPIGVTLFVMGLTWFDNPFSWNNAHILVPFILGCVLLISLVIYEVWFNKTGLFHRNLFSHDRNFAIALFAIFVEGVTFFAANNFFPLEVSILFETDQIMVGLRFGIVFVAAFLSGFVASAYSSWSKHVRLPLVVSFLCCCVFYAAMISVGIGSSKAVWVYAVFLGVGLGGCLTMIVVAAHFSAAPELISLCSGLLIAFRSLGASVGLPVFSAIFNSQITKFLPAQIAAAVLPLGLTPKALPDFIGALSARNQTALASIPGITPEIIQAGAHGLQSAYIKSFRAIHITALVIAVFAVIASCFIIDPKGDFTMHVDAPLEEESLPEKGTTK